eukprot:6580762-Alexandrium_andersonii.AAC.1
MGGMEEASAREGLGFQEDPTSAAGIAGGDALAEAQASQALRNVAAAAAANARNLVATASATASLRGTPR